MLGPGDLWYKDAIIYSLNVETFQDSDGDGIGDFAGLTSRLDYLHALGVTCVWILPFYPSPNRDNGYDVADYYTVDPRLGSLGDFVDFLRVARERGIRVMIDLVVNHTSVDHPWFQAARRDPRSKYRNYYVWSDELPSNHDEGMVFPGIQESTWTKDPEAGAYYFHRFYDHQPDLNLGNPAVREEIRKIIGFWLELGVSGFRLDAAPFLIERKGAGSSAEGRKPHTFFRYMRNFLSWRRGDAALLAEANVSMDEVEDYVGAGDKLHMLLNFFANQHLFLALAKQRAEPLLDALRGLAPLPPTAQWANFLRNHDELDLGRLAEEDRELVYETFAPDPEMRLYERGIRRRLAPMFDNDRRRLELAHSLLLALPGTPVLRYGDEIGMGEDLSLPERYSVRTPMQWAATRNGGFSTAPASQLVRPVPDGGDYAPERVNAAAQQRDPGSLLNWLQRALGIRKACREIGWGAWRILDSKNDAVFALCYAWEGQLVATFHNLADAPGEAHFEIEPSSWTSMTEILSDREYGRITPDGRVPLDGYGYRWFRTDERSA